MVFYKDERLALFIDGASSGHFSRAINHDEDASCNLYVVHGLDPRSGPIVRMLAKRPIAVGDELSSALLAKDGGASPAVRWRADDSISCYPSPCAKMLPQRRHPPCAARFK